MLKFDILFLIGIKKKISKLIERAFKAYWLQKVLL